jgi:opine dehydrogenase
MCARRWDIHNEGTQPSIRRVTTQLDTERMNVREALGYGGPHFPLADHYDDGGEEWMYGDKSHSQLVDSGDWSEKLNLTSHRYMLEDLGTGLSFLVSVAEWAGVEAPVATGLLALGSSICSTDFRTKGRTLENLGLGDKSIEQMQSMLQEGFGDD